MKTLVASLKTMPLFFVFICFYSNVLVLVSINDWIEKLNQNDKIQILVPQDLTEGEITYVVNQAKATLPIQEFRLISTDELLKNYSKKFKNISDLILSDKDFLQVIPQIIEITLSKKLTGQENTELKNKLININGIEEVQMSSSWYDSTKPFFGFIKSFSFSFAIVLLVTFLIILVHYILSHLASKQKEIEIQSLLGAEPKFIRKPFYNRVLLQTFFVGLLSLIAFSATIQYLEVSFRSKSPININTDQSLLICSLLFLLLVCVSGLLVRLYLSDKKLLKTRVLS